MRHVNKFWLFRPLSLQYFVKAAPENWQKALAFKVAAQAAPILQLGQLSGNDAAYLLGLDQYEVSSSSLLLNKKEMMGKEGGF